ncbi:unnamed protein product [Callosobruchus maculatus]|uniref:Uncharacterized protein n=1 Tax=Callosobruchus maculatus TaxID=64391 RepID=A0A653C1J2_CALMS|nr:unnamed protein product [Callosobruchus maculatus]
MGRRRRGRKYRVPLEYDTLERPNEKKTPPRSSTIHLNDLTKSQSSLEDSDEDKESYDAFPQNGEEEENPPPAAPSDGQGGHGWSEAQQVELLQRRKRLKNHIANNDEQP